MIDRIARDRLAELIRHFAAGRMTNDEFDDRSSELVFCDRRDGALWAARDATWCIYSDLESYSLTGKDRLSRETRKEVAKWILFLHSDLEYEWPFRGISMFNGPLWLIPFDLLTLGLAARLWWKWRMRRRKLAGDWDCWPFLRRTDFDNARRNPRLLAGVCG